MVSSGSGPALFPVLLIISIPIFRGVNTGQRCQPFQRKVHPHAKVLKSLLGCQVLRASCSVDKTLVRILCDLKVEELFITVW